MRFVVQMIHMLPERVAKNWRKFDAFLDLFFHLMVFSCEDIENEKEKFDTNSEAYKVGVELFFKYDMIRWLGDFVLQENSPYHEPGQMRIQMGGAYSNPNFSAVLKLLIIMISD